MNNHRFVLAAGESRTITVVEPGEYEVVLSGEGAAVVVRGAFHCTQASQVLVQLVVRHQASHTKAETLLKGAVSDTAKLTLKGSIVIESNCSDVQSFLTERILLLSPHAVGEAIPELEILSDDVKCSHAASISTLSADQLFYLQSRGLSKDSAEKLLVQSFLALI